VLLRLPFVAAPLSSDEGGFLVLARQWHLAGPGGSLYGATGGPAALLVATFQLADALGGLIALRLIGALAAAITVVAVGSRSTGCPARPAAWASASQVVAGRTDRRRRQRRRRAPRRAVRRRGHRGDVVASPLPCCREPLASAAAGACAVAAVLVKQNMLTCSSSPRRSAS